MRPEPDLSIVVPAFNEEGRLEPTLRSYLGYCRASARAVELIVVDDGSVDGTSRLVEELAGEFPELHLIRLAENRGKGFAVRSGVVNARGHAVLFADADGATPINEIERLEAALREGNDLAIGSRAIVAREVRVNAKLYRRIMGRVFHGMVEALTVRGVRDTQCGFKLFRGPVAHDLFSRMRMSGFSFDVELLMMAQRRGYRIAEVPVNWAHQPGSKVNLALDSMLMLRDLFVIRSRYFRGEYNAPHLSPRRSNQAPAAPAEASFSTSDAAPAKPQI